MPDELMFGPSRFSVTHSLHEVERELYQLS
jgi:hypothetical protein